MHKIVKNKGREDTFDNEIRVETSLPPAVQGQLRCFLAVRVDWIIWKVKNHPKDIQVCLQWWGETGNGTMFWPVSRKLAAADKHSFQKKESVTALFPVCSGPKQFDAYLHDMGVLLLDVLHSKTLKSIGKIEIHEITQLSASHPIDRWYPVTSLSVQPVKFADVHVVLKFEPVDVVGQDISSYIPVIDQNFEQNLNSVLDDNEHGSLDNNLVELTEINHEHKSLKKESVNLDDDHVQTRENINQEDVISSLIKRGKSLRDSIVESNASIDDLEPMELSIQNEVDFDEEEPHQRSIPGSLFKEILKFSETDDLEVITKDSKLPIDLILQNSEEKLMFDYNSTSSVGSDSDDPVYDETLLQDLFYVNKVQSGMLVLEDESRDVDDDVNEGDKKEVIEPNITEENGKTKSTKKFHDKTPDTISTKVPEVKVSQPTEIVDTVGTYEDTLAMFPKKRQPGDAQDQIFLTRLGINKLTALGRVTAARVTIQKLNMQISEKDHGNSKTYFIEYEFPVDASTENDPKHNYSRDVGLEITRIATKKSTAESIVFNHHAVFPVFFNSNVTSFWWNFELRIKVFERKSEQKSPLLIGVGNVSLKNVLLSQSLQFDGSILIKSPKCHEGSSSSSENLQLAKLEVKISLISNGKDLDFHESALEQIQGIDNCFVTNTEDEKPASYENNGSRKKQYQPTQIHIGEKQTTILNNNRRDITLMTLLWISEGRNIVENGHGFRVLVPGTSTRSNFYLISRMFWTNDTSRSSICWGRNDPRFNFKQISPVLLTSALLDRMHNNFITLEVWNKSSGVQDDKLVGIAKLPLQQLYLSYKEEQTTKVLMKSKFPVVAVDGWINIKNPFKDSCQGDLRVLLAMGSETQIARLQDIKQCSTDENYGKLLTNMGNDRRSQLNARFSRQDVYEKQVEHSFEITVEKIKKLFAFEKTLWGETDCFIQYNFPYQSQARNEDLSQEVPGLQNHRTPTTLYIPDTTFNDVSRYRIILPETMPVQRFLLAAFHGSWTSSGISTTAGVTFELWKRHYYPNIRDQLVTKGILPLAKLCGMITMQKPGQASIQSFSLPLIMLPSSEDKKIEHGGLLDITIKYRQSTLSATNTSVPIRGQTVEGKPDVCLAIEIIRACGLKCALSKLAEKDSSLTYASEVGGNPFVKVKLPFNVKIDQRATRTIARTFTPEFGYRMEFVLPLHMKEHIIGDDQESSGTLAECLELGEVLFEIWHKRHRETYEDFDIAEVHGHHLHHITPTSDVLLGVVKIPLQQLLFNHTGIKGWFPVTVHKLDWSNEDHSSNVLNSTAGGLELKMNFTEAKERETIIDGGRAMGWCPPLWYEIEDGQWLNETKENDLIDVGQGLSLAVVIKKVWIPKAITRSIQSLQGLKGNKMIGCYIRYKFYDTKPVFSAICGVRKIKETDVVLCDLKHRHSYLVKTTSPFIWYIREEQLEIQVWLTSRNNEEKSTLPHKRDKLVGSAFVNLFPLLNGNKKQSEVSDLYPLFRSSAVDLSGAGLHVQLVLQKPNSNKKPSHDVDEDIVSTEHNSSVMYDKLSISMASSGEEDVKTYERHNEEKKEERSSSYKDGDDNIIAAHIVVEQALHLPLFKTAANKSIQPNPYVTYRQKSDDKPVKTKIVQSSTSPIWSHEKLIKFRSSEIAKKVIIFKVWHSQNNSGMVEESKRDEVEDDFLVGSASVDLSPLASGLRQVVGWYNVVDLSGQCKGQIKVGVIPVSPISSYKTTSQKGCVGDGLAKKSAGYLSNHFTQSNFINEVNLPIEKTALDSLTQVEDQNSSKCFLLRQLRQNMKELDVLKERLRQRLINKDDGLHTELYTPGDLGVNLFKKSDHETKTSGILDNDLIKAESTNYSNVNVPSPTMQDTQVNISQPSIIFSFGEQNEQRRGFLEKDDASDVEDNDVPHQVTHRDNYIDSDDNSDDDDVINENNKPVEHGFGANDNGDNHFLDDVSDCDNVHPSINTNSSDNDDNYDQLGDDHKVDCNLDFNDKPVEQSLCNINEKLDVVGHSRDESVDSFFDIFQRNKEVSEDVKRHCDSAYDVIDPPSVVSRKNLDRLKNVFNEVSKEVDPVINVDKADDDEGRNGVTFPSSRIAVERGHSVKEPGNEILCHSQHKLAAESDEEVKEVEATIENESAENETSEHKNSHLDVSLFNKPSFPNFFMPPKDLEQSMRSLRLAATFRKEPKNNIHQQSESLEGVKDSTKLIGKEKDVAKSFANWKQVEEIKTTGNVPLTSKETSRLAKIFSSTYSAAQEK